MGLKWECYIFDELKVAIENGFKGTLHNVTAYLGEFGQPAQGVVLVIAFGSVGRWRSIEVFWGLKWERYNYDIS